MFSRISILHKLYSPLSDDGMREGGILVKILRLGVPSILFIETPLFEIYCILPSKGNVLWHPLRIPNQVLTLL